MAATGTNEWAKTTANCITGCAHRCLYCYANEMAARFGRVHPEGWGHEVVNEKAAAKGYGKRKGSVMFPTTHDITPDNMDTTLPVLRRLLEAGNQVLVVSKPHLEVVQRIAAEFDDYKAQVLLRFTIGALDDRILAFWEPGAPGRGERFASLLLANRAGWRTSVSMEPLLEVVEDKVVEMVHQLAPWVTEDIWIGKLNKGAERLKKNGQWNEKTERCLSYLEASQSDDRIRALHARLEHHPLVMRKESIKTVVGLSTRNTADDSWARPAGSTE